MTTPVVRTVLMHELRNVPRDRGVLAYGIGLLLITECVLRLAGSAPRALVTLMNLVLVVVPLVTIVFGVISWHASREFNELLLAQPVRRRALFAALYAGLIGPLAAAFSVGLLLPFVLRASWMAEAWLLLFSIWASGVLLTAVFGGLALLIGVTVDDRLRGVGLALAVWLLLTVVYDGGVLVVATTFSDYPLEKPMLALTLGNPVDLARTLVIMQSDAAALMGYTGAVMHRFLGSVAGSAASAIGLLLWTLVPAWLGRRTFERRDF